MKPEVIIQQGLKSANILLKNAQKRAAELDHLKGELVIINTSLNFMLHQQRIQIFHSLSHDLIACSGYSRTRQ